MTNLTNLQEIIDHINYQDGGVKAAKAAIAELVEGALPEKIEEGDGWNIHFTNGKEKGKVRSCCPGDDIAYVQNKTIDEIRNNLIKAGVLNG